MEILNKSNIASFNFFSLIALKFLKTEVDYLTRPYCSDESFRILFLGFGEQVNCFRPREKIDSQASVTPSLGSS